MYRLFLAFLLFAVPLTSFASSVVRSGEAVSVSANQAVEGDFYAFGNDVVVSGEVTEDVLTAASALKINGQVGKDVLVAAGKVDVDGVIGEDLRIVGGTVVVSGEVKGDLVVVAASLKVLSTAKVAGDILFFGSEAEVAGQVGKSIFGTSESLRVDGVVGGDIDVTANKITLGEQADITGMVKYVSLNELVRAQNARVAGKVVKNDPLAVAETTARDLLIPLLVLLFAALVWYLLFPRLLGRVVVQGTEHAGRSLMVGFGFLILTPIAAGILMASALGALLGLALFFLYFGVVLMSVSVVAAVAGVYLYKIVKKDASVSLPKVILGGVTTYLLLFVPVVGPLVLVLLWLLTLGALATHLYRSIRVS
jgi:cytoskeletal protein CcmA (bactofilin family)